MGDTGEVQGLSNYGSAGVAWVTLSTGQWYYEVELLSDGVMQIGWCDTLFIGDDNEGDGVRVSYILGVLTAKDMHLAWKSVFVS